MSTRKPVYPKNPNTELKAIKYYSDYQLPWDTLIPRLREYSIQTVDFLSMTGDAPKDFITDSEYRPGHRTRQQRSESYIAKVGSKFYPNESITEQLITEIGKQVVRFFVESCGSPGSSVYAALERCTNPFCKA